VQTNLMEMEARGLESVELQDFMAQEFDMAPDTLSTVVSSLYEVYRLDAALSELAACAR